MNPFFAEKMVIKQSNFFNSHKILLNKSKLFMHIAHILCYILGAKTIDQMKI